MRLLNVRGRLSIATSTGLVDVSDHSSGRFSSDPQAIYERWQEFRDWASSSQLDKRLDGGVLPVEDLADLEAPVPRPRQVFAIGLNYFDHAAESGFTAPSEPVVFTKFVSSFTGANRTVSLPPGKVDWEVEVIAVIGSGGRNIPEARAWSHIAGLTVGQDLSERVTQMQGPAPQFSLAKSFPGFAPMGPALVTVDEISEIDDLQVTCELNGETVQSARTSEMIFSIPTLVALLSRIVTLLPGDVIFTGTPPGVGMGRSPERYLSDGDVLVSRVEGIGEMQNSLTASGPKENHVPHLESQATAY
ncbi:fumarylacetoacetate hydrolase family protein [Rhodococcus rhodochrous]|uniref:fumarylacetoacetate hydrolase family protein n=1 Tax=Rhodococcus rhodochrous TaxID=1829 RepID=UPI001783DC56|nr:fumarylacetoacetate hydrolase family protein [Rhodococcus rhodochrous]QOH59424.1 fumarylacetoacetate hydrolase [Rhodococcus rhodochrous]